MTAISSLLASAAVAVIRVYRRTISPFLGAQCRFYPTCSAYAEEAFMRKLFPAAAAATVSRLLKCHPFHPGGYDPLE